MPALHSGPACWRPAGVAAGTKNNPSALGVCIGASVAKDILSLSLLADLPEVNLLALPVCECD